MMLLSYFIGQKKYPIEYDLKSAGIYFALAAFLYVIGMYVPIKSEVLRLLYRTLLLGAYAYITIRRDLPLRELPYVGKYFR